MTRRFHSVPRKGFVLSIFSPLLALVTGAAAAPVHMGNFASDSEALPTPWQLVQFDQRVPATHYRALRWDGRGAVEATANASMALLARPLTIDLQGTPVLCWMWRVEGMLQKADLRQKTGDDYAARVYVTFSLPPQSLDLGLRMKLALGRSLYGASVPDAAVNYVWDNKHPVGTRTFNAYTDRAAMVVQRTGKEQVGHWVSERANVLADATKAFGPLPFKASQLAVASDTDNTGEQVRAGFAELHFVGEMNPVSSRAVRRHNSWLGLCKNLALANDQQASIPL